MNLDGFRYPRKARLLDFQLINAVRQTLQVQIPLFAGRQSISILICPAGDLHGCFHAEPARIAYFETQFAAIALAEERQGSKEKEYCKSVHQESASGGPSFRARSGCLVTAKVAGYKGSKRHKRTPSKKPGVLRGLSWLRTQGLHCVPE